jgi:AcrR family transcriptional regulator
MKLTRDDWLNHGMKTLAGEGFGGLKADLLAKSLKVSRGSFYWHFRDLKEFHRALLDEWHKRATQQVIDWLEHTATGPERLRLLVRRAWVSTIRTERAVRAWATHSPEIARRLDAVDRQRIEYITSLLQSAGLSPKQARARALFVASAYLGRMLLSERSFGAIAPRELDAIVNSLQA